MPPTTRLAGQTRVGSTPGFFAWLLLSGKWIREAEATNRTDHTRESGRVKGCDFLLEAAVEANHERHEKHEKPENKGREHGGSTSE